jgi:hypothetical protein
MVRIWFIGFFPFPDFNILGILNKVKLFCVKVTECIDFINHLILNYHFFNFKEVGSIFAIHLSETKHAISF